MTPVILLSDGYLGTGSEPWKFPKMADLPNIITPSAKLNGQEYQPYFRDKEKLSRFEVLPGTKGLEHRLGGIEKEDLTGNISYDPDNHEKMVMLRAKKVDCVANYIPEQEVIGDQSGEVLIVGWGGTYGSLLTACKELQTEGKSVSLTHFNYINPLPKNTGEVFGKFKKILVCELNLGQFIYYLRGKYPEYKYEQFNKVQGLPFTVTELKEKIKELL